MSLADETRTFLGESLRTRVMTGYALCAIAEGHIHAGELERALKTVQAVRRMVAEVTVLLSESHPHSAIREAFDILPDLENRIQAMEAALPPDDDCHSRAGSPSGSS